VKTPKIQFEHPTQIAASTFLRAVAENDAAAVWERLSRETRGLLEGLYAARSAVALQHAAGVALVVGLGPIPGHQQVRPLRTGSLTQAEPESHGSLPTPRSSPLGRISSAALRWGM